MFCLMQKRIALLLDYQHIANYQQLIYCSDWKTISSFLKLNFVCISQKRMSYEVANKKYVNGQKRINIVAYSHLLGLIGTEFKVFSIWIIFEKTLSTYYVPSVHNSGQNIGLMRVTGYISADVVLHAVRKVHENENRLCKIGNRRWS